jgi:2-hydroxychromene-2-carboxylate isomerase
MAPASFDFWFDYSCPFAYLASTQVEALAARTGATLVWQPMLLGGVFRAAGTSQNLMNLLSPAKAAHNGWDMQRWADVFGVTLRMPGAHPMRTVEALRATLLTGVDPRVVHGFYRAYWVDGRPPSDEATIRDVLSAAGHDAPAILARLDDPAVKDELRARTDRAVALGIFGAPAFVVSGRLYWGQDRMHFVERELGGTDRTPTLTTPPLAPGKKAMTKHVLEIYWDFSSPFSYLGSTQAKALAERTGAELVWRPMLLGGLFKSIGQAEAPMLTWSQAKREYVLKDLSDWAAYWGVPFRFPSRFPMLSIKAMRTWLALPPERRDDFRERTYRAYWAEDRDISDDAVLSELIGQDAPTILARTQTPEIKQELIEATRRAEAAGVFGAPTWVVDGKQLFWGQDRIVLVERALRT